MSYGLSKNIIFAVLPINESRFVCYILNCTSSLCSTPDETLLNMFLTIQQCTSFRGSFADMKAGSIYIRADQYGAYESCFELNSRICWKYYNPSERDNLYRNVYVAMLWSLMASCLRQQLFFIFCRSHIPAPTTDDVLTE